MMIDVWQRLKRRNVNFPGIMTLYTAAECVLKIYLLSVHCKGSSNVGSAGSGVRSFEPYPRNSVLPMKSRRRSVYDSLMTCSKCLENGTPEGL